DLARPRSTPEHTRDPPLRPMPRPPHEWPRSPTALLFYYKAPATTEIYTLSLHDALPISRRETPSPLQPGARGHIYKERCRPVVRDRKSTRLNSSHGSISYAVFCLKKKKKTSARQDGNLSSKSVGTT